MQFTFDNPYDEIPDDVLQGWARRMAADGLHSGVVVAVDGATVDRIHAQSARPDRDHVFALADGRQAFALSADVYCTINDKIRMKGETVEDALARYMATLYGVN